MRHVIWVCIGCALAACDSKDGELSEIDIGVSRVTATVSYDADTNIYTVTPVGGLPVAYIGDARGDIGGFRFAEPDTLLAFLASQASEGSRATLLVENTIDASSAVVLLSRPANSSLPTTDTATYSGQYLSALFVNDVYADSISGKAAIEVDVENRRIAGVVTNRTFVVSGTTDIPDLILTQGRLTGDGVVTGNGIDPYPVAIVGDFRADLEFLGAGRSFEYTSGSYRGLISGEEGALFLGGVELDYLVDDTEAGREVGAIFTFKNDDP